MTELHPPVRGFTSQRSGNGLATVSGGPVVGPPHVRSQPVAEPLGGLGRHSLCSAYVAMRYTGYACAPQAPLVYHLTPQKKNVRGVSRRGAPPPNVAGIQETHITYPVLDN